MMASKKIFAKTQLAHRAAALFDSEEFSDVTFLVGPDEEKAWRFPAHKLILSISSPVFQTMFESSLSEAKLHPEVRITDVEPVAFENLLRSSSVKKNNISGIKRIPKHEPTVTVTSGEMEVACQSSSEVEVTNEDEPTVPVTSGEIEIACQSSSEVEVTNQDVSTVQVTCEEEVICQRSPTVTVVSGGSCLQTYIYTDVATLSSIKSALLTLYAAHKYMVQPLVITCTDYLLRALDAKNVLEVYQCIKLYDEEDSNARLLLKCLKTIDESAEAVLVSDYFQNLDHATLTMILSRDNLQIKSELTAFYAALNWAAAECRRRKIPLTPPNKRLVLGDTLFSIRFLCMSRDEFLEGPATTSVLSKEEEDAFDAKILGHDDMALPDSLETRAPALKRKRIKNSVFWAVYSNMLICSRHKRSSIIFSVERNVIIVGFGLGAFADQSQGQFEESFQLRLSDMENVVIREENFTNKAFHVQSSVFPVRFSKPVCVMANKRYQATVIFLKEAEYAVMKRRNDHIRGESAPKFHFHSPSGPVSSLLTEEKSQFAFIYYYY